MRLKIAVFSLVLVLVPVMVMAQAPAKNIVDTLAAAGNFKTFIDLLGKADIKELTMPGPFTVFAPTDEAFAKLSKEDTDRLMKDKTLLQKVLYYHIVPGKYKEADMVTLKECKTLCPTTGGVALLGMKVDKARNKIIAVNGAKVIKPDVMAPNGVIQVIDAVLVTPMRKGSI